MKKEKVMIKLAEIPEEGKSFSYNQVSAEMNLGLKDLIDNNKYSVDFTVRPIGNVYEVAGQLKTELTRICSLCGYDLQIPVELKLREILLEREESQKGDTQSKGGFLTDDNENTAVRYVSGGVLNAEEMIHEAIGLEDPAYPSCNKEKCENLDEVRQKMEALAIEAQRALQETPSSNPFAMLKDLKL